MQRIQVGRSRRVGLEPQEPPQTGELLHGLDALSACIRIPAETVITCEVLSCISCCPSGHIRGNLVQDFFHHGEVFQILVRLEERPSSNQLHYYAPSRPYVTLEVPPKPQDYLQMSHNYT